MSSTVSLTHRNNKNLVKALVRFVNLKVARPSLKAFIFAYLYVTLPKVINHISIAIKKKDYKSILPRILKVITKAFHPFKFPAFAASLIAIINILEPIVARFLRVSKRFHGTTETVFVATFISSFIAASVSFPQFQNHIIGYGRFLSLDLTLLVLSRAIDTTLSSTLSAVLPPFFQQFGDGLLFIASCTPIMYSWFFRPDRLPPAYRKWITSAANMDDEIVGVLKSLHDGTVKYGEKSDYLADYCERYGQDPAQADFSQDSPLPCKTVHAFKTSNCEVHALWRFVRGFKFAFKLYGSINAFMLLIPKKNIAMTLRLRRALQSSIRSSCFLGAFIALDWYGVCLTRTRLFPKLFPEVPKQTWDITWGPAVGAFLCGFSSFVESAQRRKELALFVFPRALGTLVPTEATDKNLLIERFTFSMSMAILVAYCKKNPKSVRGIFGKGLTAVMSISS
ncbi:hypothetical protein PSN45_003908 [Yamadazyma tenuis]|uniref:Transmembrane protein 135 N-terminal domain-containing protein n=1 Tax=Candida tenuis (strain ATCC 10573 / BCRC 21748 / CBS 615 / JCM 9827 / NBRC 10315 / NRRL Y-1498 / VKM Y-70) TaxID=590646 RepID=G3B4X7_CANTC|nr:uncharacterized protein CANTEDRAFT_114040 [Yamadazyma tenuis ATCC 10573]XP_006686636.1 uncharacterized protein CANTEDRAFT_114040 [Yamadazyma tenuis ATCC 10573]EGV64321.1 hypothetical protein CANTEDRAFT_114040 [Yamadazyma tenuis ATCC 10573]EGV64322.1 hypothetical protein CANTEDRAFT_114040 [Yamadazyma tenuis ATCC 10573]WEJ96369.1 hypothetical protein PSN45_003908 [Yamadazyma tenuis]